jgi:hypothetical protein
MTDTVVIAEQGDENSGYRFSWGLAFAGGIAATAVTFFLLMLGSGFGLLLVHPMTQSMSSAPSFFTGGAIYFFAAQAFGFAVGGHLAGRLLAPEIESQLQEDFRAGAHGFVAWAIAVLATLTVVAILGAAAGTHPTATSAIYGMTSARAEMSEPTAYYVDKLFRPVGDAVTVAPADADARARAEAGRILDTGFIRGEQIAPDDYDRLVDLVSARAGLSHVAASARIDALQKDVQAKTRKAADIARRIASTASLWIAFSLLFGAIVASAAAIFARNEDDRDFARG